VEFLEPIDASKYSLEEREILNERIRAALAAALPSEQRPLDTSGTATGLGPSSEQTEDAKCRLRRD
jgi:hypothetical protein